MSKTTIALEAAVVRALANAPVEGQPQTNRQRVEADRAFASILKIIAPRIRHFIRQYGLASHWDDAEQCCAIGVHRALQAYDPEKAQFTTFVNWQLRGELQALRFRLMTDQRPSAKKVSATTVSLSAVAHDADGEEYGLDAMLVDEDAVERTEAGAADHMAAATRDKLIEDYVAHLRTVGREQLARRARSAADAPAVTGAPRLKSALYPIAAEDIKALEQKIAAQREAIERRLGAVAEDADAGDEAARERQRQIAKRAAAAIAELAGAGTRFARPIKTAKTNTARRAVAVRETVED
jgi:RNA polymerase sigma-32 factor